jgi:hypothetical protein
MAMSQRLIDILMIHREALNATKTFEEYRDAHVAYIGMLIEQHEANLAKDNSVQRWVAVLDEKQGVEE